MVMLLIQNDLQEVIVMIFDNIIEKRAESLRKVLKDETK